MAQGCVFCFRPETARVRGGNNALTSSLHTLERYALDRKGVVGSLYDAGTDNLLSTLSVPENSILRKDVKEVPICKLIKVDNSNRDNILQLIGIQEDPRVSIALDMTSVTEGTLMLHTYVFPTDRVIRLIDYSHIDQEECLCNNIQMVRRTLPDSLSNDNATHIITSVQRGIDFVIVLELPENANHNEIDSILEKLCKYFIEPTAAFLSTEDQQKINRLHPTIFTPITNIHSLAENRDLSVSCQHIHQYIYQDRNNFPLSYTLHPVKCIYYDKIFNGKMYCKLDQYIVRNIEQKLLPLSNKIKRIQSLFNEVLSQLSQLGKGFIEQPAKDLCKVKTMYIEVQQVLAKKVEEFRGGNFDVSLLYNELNNAHFGTLDSELITLHTTVVELQTKACSIAKLKTDHQTECFNMDHSEGTNGDERNLESTTKQLQSSTSVVSATKLNEINILLIGETGVGKSTFINAFVNYLAFHSFKEAESGDPIVLISISFVITVGDQFQEEKIEFGIPDANENHKHSGQSVTQHCKSYIFTIGNNIKLRIIDTPGIGDTRGAEQDNKNIEHILSYTSNLPHLNAICFLLKPNTTRLHALFRSCFTQLFHFLGPKARENIIFCFTNTRATFYAPGDTAKLLRKMLDELPNDHIPSFAKKNTFCFDSESFRYLAIIKAEHKLAIDDNQKLDFEKSWTISVAESIRLLDYIESRPKYEMNKWHSTKHAQMMITLLVRPILETIYNALRNLVLLDKGDKQHVIELKAQPVSLPAWFCASCSHEITRIENTSIVTHSIHYYRISDECGTCHCTLDKHLPVLYELKYHSSGQKGKGFHAETKIRKDRLLHGTLLMTQFLLHTADISQNPFLAWFDLFIRDQEYLCSEESSSCFNATLCNKLYEEKNKYVNGVKDVELDDERIELDVVYNCIEQILTYPILSEQMHAIRASQMEMMKNNEHDVSSCYSPIDMTALHRRSTIATNH